MKYLLKLLLEAVVIALVVGIALWYLVTAVLPKYLF